MRNNLSREGKRRYWKEHLEQFSTSGLSEREYCSKRHLKPRTFLDWKRKFEGNQTKIELTSSESALVELPIQNLQASLATSPRLCVVVDQHFEVVIEKGFDPEELQQVIRILRSI